MKQHRSGAAVMIAVAATLGFAPGHAHSETVTINMVDGLKFEPAVVVINAGDEVVWTNMSSPPHDTVSGDPGDPNPGELWSSGLLFEGDSFTRTFEAGETSDYFCSVHSTRMFGRVFVDGTGVQGTMIPANTIVTAQKITFDTWLLNLTGANQSVNGRIRVRDPGGNPHTVLDKNGNLGPMARLRVPFTITLPGGVPAGDYTVRLELRDSGGVLVSTDEDTYTKPSLDGEAPGSYVGVIGEGSDAGFLR
jgi:plastocyanin